uniref:Uncharacterized protein n=1 Tax=Trichogramma kaykai TaxID=54128 RepID=A0ABD2WH31_9HYME
MESSDTGDFAIRVKEEPRDESTIDNDSETVEEKPNLKNFQLLSCPRENSCKDVKPELTSLSTIVCKYEHPNCQSIIKVENENQTNDTNEKIFIDFECKDVKAKLKSLSTTISKTEHQSYLPVVKVENQIQTSLLNEKLPESKKIRIFEERTHTKLSYKGYLCPKTDKRKECFKIHINTTHKSKPFEYIRSASRAYTIKETRSRACRTHSTYYLLRCIRGHDRPLSIRPLGCHPRHRRASDHPRGYDRRGERRGGGGRCQLQRQLSGQQRRAAQPRRESQRLRQLLRLRHGHTRDHAVPGRAALQRRGEGLRLADQRLLRQHLRRLSQLAVLHASPRAPSTGR